MSKATQGKYGAMADKALKEAVKKALERHMKLGVPSVFVKGGKMVYLMPDGTIVNKIKDLKKKTIRSYNSAPDGKFRFAQVNMAVDFEIWAEKNGKKSAVKTVSSWDTRKEFDCELKLK